jgi:hypothetical protein
VHARVPRRPGRAIGRGIGLLCLGLGFGAAEAAEPAQGRRFDAPQAWHVPLRREAAAEGSRGAGAAGAGFFDERGAGGAGWREPPAGALFSGALGSGNWRYQLQVKPGPRTLVRGVSVRLQLRF